MNSKIEVYMSFKKPIALRSYKFLFFTVLFFLIAFGNVLSGNNNPNDSINTGKAFAYFLMFLIFFLATRGIFDAITEIAIDNSESTIEVKYVKGIFRKHERTKSCSLRFIKYFYDYKRFEQNPRLKQELSIEMINGDYFDIKESKGFTKESLAQLARTLESHNCRKFDS